MLLSLLNRNTIISVFDSKQRESVSYSCALSVDIIGIHLFLDWDRQRAPIVRHFLQ